jgi:hypothetical protein
MGMSFDPRMPSLRACEAGVAIHLSFTAERQELDCFVAALLAMTAWMAAFAAMTREVKGSTANSRCLS